MSQLICKAGRVTITRVSYVVDVNRYENMFVSY